MKFLLPILAMLAVSGCALIQAPPASGPDTSDPASPEIRPVQRPETGAGVQEVGAGGQSADALDTTTAAEKAEATAPSSGGASLGQTVASLGDPTEAGFWLKTPLVTAETAGRVEAPGGASVNVTLIPIDGPDTAGSRISLPAMRALGLGLTDLPTVSVFKS